MHLRIFLSIVLLSSFILYTALLMYITKQNVDAVEDYGSEITFIAPLDPYQIISDDDDRNKDRYYEDLDSSGVAYLSIDLFNEEVSFAVFVEGMSYEEGDDIEIIQIRLGKEGERGPTILSLCNEKKEKGHCREGPGLSIEGILKEKDLKGPLKHSSIVELVRLLDSGESYVYVQSRDHPEGEVRGQIYHY